MTTILEALIGGPATAALIGVVLVVSLGYLAYAYGSDWWLMRRRRRQLDALETRLADGRAAGARAQLRTWLHDDLQHHEASLATLEVYERLATARELQPLGVIARHLEDARQATDAIDELGFVETGHQLTAAYEACYLALNELEELDGN